MSAVNREDLLGIWKDTASTEGDRKVPSYYVCHFAHMIFKSKVTMADWTLKWSEERCQGGSCSVLTGIGASADCRLGGEGDDENFWQDSTLSTGEGGIQSV